MSAILENCPDRRRRRLLAAVSGSLLLGSAARALADGLVPTPAQTRGPFYPVELPLDPDSDLVQVQGRPQRAMGTITHLLGRILDLRGEAIAGAWVEIWQCDHLGRYHHPRDRGPADENFQGYGRHLTGTGGGYRFRTIRPVAYGFRAPHIHVSVTAPQRRPLVTQLYVDGAEENARDGLLAGIRDPRLRARVVIPFDPAPDAPGELIAHADIVLPA